MKFLILLALVIVTIADDAPPPPPPGKTWAILVAGSNTWMNYRHQADVCHAYQILHRHGIPDERIIVMMYDDIAHNEENPTPGKIINHPHGPDVYHGVPKDYTKELVTPKNFMKILLGEDMTGIGSGKTIKSGPNDRIFVNFVDHGAPGLVAFPRGELTVKELHRTLTKMHMKKKYAQLVFYMEACESGSMFAHRLPANLDIFATTAASPNESSYAIYYDSKLQTYLGDVYSVRWMENSDKSNLNSETLEAQFKITKNETNTSHVEQYGDLKMASEHVSLFQGDKNVEPIHYPIPVREGKLHSPCYEVPLDILFRRHSEEMNYAKKAKIFQEIQTMQKKRYYLEQVMKGLVNGISQRYNDPKAYNLMKKRSDLVITQLDCHNDVVHAFSENCFNLGENPYALKFVYVLANICEDRYKTSEIVAFLESECKGKIRPVPGGIH